MRGEGRRRLGRGGGRRGVRTCGSGAAWAVVQAEVRVYVDLARGGVGVGGVAERGDRVAV